MDNNNSIFEKSDKGPVLYIRHGISLWNEFNSTVTKKLEAHINTDLMDANLSEKGKEGCVVLYEKLKNMNYKYCFSSPLARCLETARIALDLNEDKEKNFKIIVVPFLQEGLNGSHDYSINIEDKKRIYNSSLGFDWSFFESLYPDIESQNLFFLDLVDGYDDNSHIIIERLQKEYSLDDVKELCVYNKTNHIRPESFKNLYKRGLKFKKYLKEFLEQENYDPEKDGKVLVFTHSNFIKYSTFKVESGAEDEPNSYKDVGYFPDNCEYITMNI
jgi:hypothetical protein